MNYQSEHKHTIPDFFHTGVLNTVFSRNFGPIIDNQKELLKNGEVYERLKKLIPSKNYLGIFIPNIDIKEFDSVLCLLILEEFLMLTSQDPRLKSDNLILELSTDEIPSHISIFNPSFNTLVAYSNEKEQHLYLLFLTDVLELMGPESVDFAYGTRTEFEMNRKPKHSKVGPKEEFTKTGSPLRKYENLRVTLPDISLEQSERFINFLDSDHDHRIVVTDVVNFALKHKLVLDSSVSYLD